MSDVQPKDTAQEELKDAEVTKVKPVEPATVETVVGGLNERFCENENNSDSEETPSYNELKEKVVSLKKKS